MKGRKIEPAPEPPKFEVKAVKYISLAFPEKAKAYKIADFATGDSLSAAEACELAEALYRAAEELGG